jgi:Uma2 family endonuclease
MSLSQYLPHYTVDDYAAWPGEWELWNGFAISMTPSPFGRHQQILSRMLRIFGDAISLSGCDCEPIAELDWVVSRDTVVRPDLILICGAVPEKYLESAPSLIVEVTSESTATHDRSYKKDLYESQRVKHYIVVDSMTKEIEHYLLDDGTYILQQPVNSVHRFILSPTCHLECDFRKL